MFNPDRDQDTICSPITASGTSGVALIRISGSKSKEIIKTLCDFLPENLESHRVYYGFLKSPKKSNNIDEVMVTYFESNRSFTFEDTIEISCHGSPLIIKKIMAEIISLEARTSDKGEFTYRAFMNGRIDLAQAESVLSLIESQSEAEAQLSLSQLEGSLSKGLNTIESDLTSVLANIEANIDYAAEDIVIKKNEILLSSLEKINSKLKELTLTYNHGSLIKDGFKVAIVGKPNMGKSTLMNHILDKDKSIVTPIEGTTRDVVDETLLINNVKFHFHDTAGIRNTEDTIELVGVKKSLEVAEKSNLIILVTDTHFDLDYFDSNKLKPLKGCEVCVLVNKTDLCDDLSKLKSDFKDKFQNKLIELGFGKNNINQLWVSFKTQDNTESIVNYFKSISELNFSQNTPTLIHLRHFEELTKSQTIITQSIDLLKNDESPELVAFELQAALVHVMSVLGKEYSDEVMDQVFKEFCLGK